MDVGLVAATTIHTLAVVIAWGYYGILGRIVMPALERAIEPQEAASTLVAVERRAVPLVALSLALAGVTGTYLLVANPHYAGLGNVLDSGWTLAMFAKHVLIAGFVLLAVVADRLIRTAAATGDGGLRRSILRRVRFAAEGATGLGALVVLLTAAAQVAP